jgi:hypothetical protein
MDEANFDVHLDVHSIARVGLRAGGYEVDGDRCVGKRVTVQPVGVNSLDYYAGRA